MMMMMVLNGAKEEHHMYLSSLYGGDLNLVLVPDANPPAIADAIPTLTPAGNESWMAVVDDDLTVGATTATGLSLLFPATASSLSAVDG